MDFISNVRTKLWSLRFCNISLVHQVGRVLKRRTHIVSAKESVGRAIKPGSTGWQFAGRGVVGVAGWSWRGCVSHEASREEPPSPNDRLSGGYSCHVHMLGHANTKIVTTAASSLYLTFERCHLIERHWLQIN